MYYIIFFLGRESSVVLCITFIVYYLQCFCLSNFECFSICLCFIYLQFFLNFLIFDIYVVKVVTGFSSFAFVLSICLCALVLQYVELS